jgi:hypothetical protein
MSYVPPFEFIRRYAEIAIADGELRVSFSYDNFVQMIQLMISGIEIDEEVYLQNGDDIAQALSDSTVASVKQHFLEIGYFKGYLPNAPQVDETWYLQEYPDVAAGIESGEIESATQHFLSDGYREGRKPYP